MVVSNVSCRTLPYIVGNDRHQPMHIYPRHLVHTNVNLELMHLCSPFLHILCHLSHTLEGEIYLKCGGVCRPIEISQS